ncbi:MAG: ABC transporter substrate-binding protein, partial [Candidatus Bathyanammoxibius sp.]
MTIIFNIRQGVYWQDKEPVNGRELTASDIEFTYHRGYGLGSGFTQAQGAVALLPSEGPGSLESVTATDKYTVIFKLKEPSIEILRAFLVDNYALMIVAREAVEAYGDLEDWENAVGTGPFILEDHVADSYLTFRKNPNYWGWDENHPENQLPYVDEISMLIIPDQNTALTGLRSGEVDEINYSLLNPLLSWEQSAALAETNPEIRQVAVAGAFSVGIGMAQASGPLSDVRVRTALQMAINLPEIAATHYGGSIEPHPWGIVGVPALYTPYDQWPEAVKEEYAYDPERARQLLEDAGYADGFDTEYLIPTIRDQDLMLIVQAYWADIGVNMVLKPMEYGAWYGAVLAKPAAGMTFWQYNGFTWPPTSLGLAWQVSGSLLNFGQAHDEVFDELSARAGASLDYEEWKTSIIEANDRGIAQHLVISLLRPTAFAVYQPWLKGVSGEREMGTSNVGPIYARLWIDQELKESM